MLVQEGQFTQWTQQIWVGGLLSLVQKGHCTPTQWTQWYAVHSRYALGTQYAVGAQYGVGTQ